jgi:putative ABC transport system permease protein
VALSFLLLAGAGLMVQSLLALQREDLGFTPEGVLKGHLLLPQARYADRPARIAAVRDVLERVRSLPGVEDVATVMPHPFRFQGSQPLFADGGDITGIQAAHHVIAGDYWRTMRVRIVDGRAFDDRDRAGSERVAVISQSVARRLWPDESPIGRRIRTSAAADAPWLTVVGVSVDVRKTFTEAIVGDTYVPYDQSPGGYLALMVRGNGDPQLLTQPLQRRLAGVAPDLPMHEVEPMTAVVARQARQQRFLATLLGVFAVATAAIALVGLYAVLTFTVTLRRREIAVRVAVGASRGQIGVAVVREGGLLVAAGLIAGVAMSALAARALSAQLYGVAAMDAPTYAIAAMLFGLFSLAAVTAPALRAARVDAVEALRID